ncbi:CRISPR-associated helicase/endonuclease Cas3 [Gordonia defluvii]|uniref:CRISPR-associated helicase/endonuclease Cas3 n=2 Tax=Gordonia defluvii TaxID=283718 RepID=A0ABP6LMW3_9ACTN
MGAHTLHLMIVIAPSLSTDPLPLSREAQTLWAKSDYEDGGAWLPLYQHIADSGDVARTQWNEFLPTATKVLIADVFEGDQLLAAKTLTWLAAGHDLGKATPAFTSQMPALCEAVEEAGLPVHPAVHHRRAKLPHAHASFLILRRHLEQRWGFSRKQAARFAAVPLGHHGAFTAPNPHFAGYDDDLLGREPEWHAVQEELAEFAAALAGLTADDFMRLADLPLDQPTAIAATALTIFADWIASSTDHFPLRSTPRSPEDARKAMKNFGLPPPWRAEAPDDAVLFAEHLGLDSPRPLQTGIIELARSIPSPELFILEAPTGEGKTKAALGTCEVLATKFGLGGVMLTLPTQATADGLFAVTKEWLDAIQGAQDVSISLAHGKSAFSTDFRSIPKVSHIGADTDGAYSSGTVVAHSYLTGRRKLATMSDFVIGTIDQLLLGALCSKHVVLRHLGLMGKVVVIDEVHASDGFMRQYLCRILTWLAAYRVPVIAMSATLPPTIRHELLAAYDAGLNRSTPTPDSDEPIVYPRITVTSPTGPRIVALPPSSRSARFTVEELNGETAEIAAAALVEASHGGNIAVVCNTVRRAQDIYRAAKESAGPRIDLRLLHSRFLTPDRIAKEQELRDRLGPNPVREQGHRPLVVVATQVIEQSLDIDFDVMFSDVAPIDLILQRAGRLHRHEWKAKQRPAAHHAARMILTGISRIDGSAPVFDNGCLAVYGAAPLLRSMATLDEHLTSQHAVTSPDDVATLVTRAYESIEAPSGWDDTWAAAEEVAANLRAEKEARADMFRIPPPARQSLVDWARLDIADPSEQRGAAQVRDSEDTIEVVLVERVNGCLRIPSWASSKPGADVNIGTVIEHDIAYAASLNTLRLPGYLGRPGIGDELIRELENDCIDTWQNSPWLRGVLPLIVDEGDAEHVGHLFHYDVDLGLVVTKKENQ